MKVPIIIEETREENQVNLKIEIPESIIYFKGHFPNYPLLPGVVQIHWAETFGKHYFPELGRFSCLEKIKFHAAIRPNEMVVLQLTYQPEKKSLLFSYNSAEKKYSSGRILLDQ